MYACNSNTDTATNNNIQKDTIMFELTFFKYTEMIEK